MLLVGLVIIIFPNSLISMLLIAAGAYFTFLGALGFVNGIKLIKFRKRVNVELIKGVLLLIGGVILLFNSPALARALSSVLFILTGILLLVSGIIAIKRTGDSSSGVMLIVIGGLIAIFPLGVTFLITRIIGTVLVIISSYYMFGHTKSS